MVAELRESLHGIVGVLSSATQRQISFKETRKPLLVFTDGACEGLEFEIASFGAVMIDIEDGRKEMFGAYVQESILRHWTESGARQTIGQTELYPVLVARTVWAARMIHRRVFYFIDNDSARDALIRTASASMYSRDILRSCAEADAVTPQFPWYARVPTASNLADDPSRLIFANLSRLGYVLVQCAQKNSLKRK